MKITNNYEMVAARQNHISCNKNQAAQYNTTPLQVLADKPITFKADKKRALKIVYRGLYEKNEKMAEKIIDAIKQSDTVRSFLDKYATKIILHANERKSGFRVNTSLVIKYRNPYQNFLQRLKGNKIELSGFGDEYTLSEPFARAHSGLLKNCENLENHVNMHLEGIRKSKAKLPYVVL